MIHCHRYTTTTSCDISAHRLLAESVAKGNINEAYYWIKKGTTAVGVKFNEGF